MSTIHFHKYHGTGNDFILVDNRDGKLEVVEPLFIRQICHRRFGIGADGFMLLESSKESIFTMRYFNSDGGESSMCGNGGRCIAAFAVHQGVAPEGVLFEFEAMDGKHHALVDGEMVNLKMQDVSGITEVPEGYFLNTGSPHVVVLRPDVSVVDVPAFGSAIRHAPQFFKGGGTNVNFMTIKEDGSLSVRTFERGVEDETWSCGTGSVASAMVAHFLGGKNTCYEVFVPGGQLNVRFTPVGKGQFEEVWLKGPAVFVFEGFINE